jgi:hypothetical protein
MKRKREEEIFEAYRQGEKPKGQCIHGEYPKGQFRKEEYPIG